MQKKVAILFAEIPRASKLRRQHTNLGGKLSPTGEMENRELRFRVGGFRGCGGGWGKCKSF